MKRIVGGLAIGLLGLGAPVFAQAQPGPGPQACPMMFNPNAIENVSGEIVGIDTTGRRMGGQGQHVVVMLRTADGVVAVHVGPLGYLQKQNVTFKLGDKLDARGSKMEFEGIPSLIAVDVTPSGGRKVLLRSEQGVPVWRGPGKPAS